MVGIGVVGYGYWGPNLVRNFHETPGARVAAVADLDPARRALAERRHPGLKTTDDFDALLQDPAVDAVAIATPAATHHALGLRALQAGKHVWLEKPMTETSAQARELAREARERDRVLLVDHTFIYTPAVRKMAELIASGEIGDVYYVDSTRVNLGLVQRDVSVICDLAVHDFAIMDHLLKRKPRAVSANGVNHFPGTPENLAYVTLYYDGGTIGHVNVSWLAPVKVRQIVVGGSRRMIAYDDLQPSEKVKVYDRGVEFSDDPQRLREMRVGYRSGDMWAPQLGTTEALRIEGEHFVDCITHGTPALTGADFGLRMVQLIEAATESMHRKGETIYLQEEAAS